MVPPASSCDWTLNPTTYNNVSTAFGLLSSTCPDDGDAVGIGVNLGGGAAAAKLNVSSNTNFTTGVNVSVTNPGNAFGAKVQTTGGGQSVRGVQAITQGTAQVGKAGDFLSYDVSPFAAGVFGQVFSGSGESDGVHGISYTNGSRNSGVIGESKSNGLVNAGLFGTQGTGYIPPAPNGNYGIFAATQTFNLGTDRAGYFRGNVNVTGLGYIPGGSWVSSDENLKENIADLPSGLAVITQLNPKSYDYLVDAFPQVGLPAGQQYGFIART